MPLTLYTLRDAAEQLGVAPSTLRHQIANGKFDARKIGKDWYVTPEAIAFYRRNRKRVAA